jgi:hypothetical protein
MTETTTTSSTQPLSLIARIIGVITSPKATFENVVAIPKPAGVLLVVALVILGRIVDPAVHRVRTTRRDRGAGEGP